MNKVYQQYFTNSNDIVTYMIDSLSLDNQGSILEPCFGEGVFLDEVIKRNKNLVIDALDLDDNLVEIGKKKYLSYTNISIKKSNFLFDNIEKKYDYIVANPPYGAWIDYSDRKELKKLYPDLYVKETYTLFLYKCINLLKDNGKLVFIIPSTFLYLHMHKNLRKFLWENTQIKEIVKFPSKFFPGISFGYSQLSIITLEKKKNIDNLFKLFYGLDKIDNLIYPLNEDIDFLTFSQKSLLSNSNYSITFSTNSLIEKLIKELPPLGDFTSCATGIYTGDNKKWLYYKNSTVKNSKDYNKVYLEKVDFSNKKNYDGFSNDFRFLPIYKGAGQSLFNKELEWFIDWSIEAVYFYKNNSKARFQNSQYYFKEGIGVPMVKTKKMTAFQIKGFIFDQSIVGVFPKDKKYNKYILGLFNSSLGSELINAINPTANNSSNYIKKIPFKVPTEVDLSKINLIVDKLLDNEVEEFTELLLELDNLFEKIYYEELI